MRSYTSYLVCGLLLHGFISLSQPAQINDFRVHVGPRVVLNDAIRTIQGTPEDIVPFKTVKISFDYSEMQVCEFKNLDEYLKHKTRKKGEAETAALTKEWQRNTETIFENKFRDYFDRKVFPIDMVTYRGADTAAVQLIVKMKVLEPHSHRNANRDLPYAYMTCLFISNDGYHYVTYELTAFGTRDNNDADRVAECYAIAGKMLGTKVTSYISKYKKD